LFRFNNSTHIERYKRFVSQYKLICQECGGNGGWKEIILDDGTGPWYDCGWCQGTGLVTPYARGIWLRLKKQDKWRGND
jgi:hypothetical protein